MNLWKIGLWLFGMLCLAVSCTDQEQGKEDTSESKLELKSESEVVFSANRQTFLITFVSTDNWQLTTGGMAWCTVDASTGSGQEEEQMVLVRLDENQDDTDRNVKITLQSADKSVSVFVVQKSEKSLTVTADRFELSGNGEYMVVKLRSDVNAGYEIDPVAADWLFPVEEDEIPEGEKPNVGVMTKASEQAFYFYAAPGLSEEGREGRIVFYGQGPGGVYLEEEVYVYQNVKDELILGSVVEYVDTEGGTVQIDVQSNVDFEVVMPSCTWVRQVEQSATRSLSSHRLYFEVDPNTEYSDRKAEIEVRKKGDPSISSVFSIVQSQLDAVILDPRGEYRIDEFEHVFSVKVRANVNVEGPVIDGYRDFLSEVDKSELNTRALTEDIYYFKATASESNVERTGYIYFSKRGDPEVRDVLKVIQGKKRTLSFSQDTVRLVASKGRFEVELTVRNVSEYDITCSDSWITQAGEPTGENQLNYSFEVADNLDAENGRRVGYVIARQRGENISDTLTVIQEGYRFVQVKEPGSLSSQILPEEKYLISSLRLSGKINGSDIRFIREMAGGTYEGQSSGNGSLIALDLTDTEIVAGGSPYVVYFGDSYYTNDEGTGLKTVPDGSNTCFYYEGIGKYMFTDCWKLENIKLPNSIRVIHEEAFRGFANQEGQIYVQQLKRVTLYPGLEVIGQKAFYQNMFLEEINFPNGLEDIGEYAFYYCRRLKTASLPNTLKELKPGIFLSCISLSSVVLGNDLERIGASVFSDCRSLSQINRPSALKEVGRGAFNRCNSLSYPLFPDGVTVIEESTYYECSLGNLVIPETVEVIEDNAFYGANITQLTLSKRLEEIGQGAFGWNHLASVTVPASVTKMGKDCFSYNDELKEIHLKSKTPPDITAPISGNTGDIWLYVPDGSESAYESHAYWGAYVHIVGE